MKLLPRTLKLTKNRNDYNKMISDVAFSGSPRYKQYILNRLRHSPFEDPLTYSESQRYAPVKQDKFIDGKQIMEVSLMRMMENPTLRKKPRPPKFPFT